MDSSIKELQAQEKSLTALPSRTPEQARELEAVREERRQLREKELLLLTLNRSILSGAWCGAL